MLALVLVGWAGAGQAASLWDHNGSTVFLEVNGTSRKFTYSAPRPGLPVTSGTVLFEGSRSGRNYVGTAYTFSTTCGALPYQVRGPVAADERKVTMSGNAPRVDSNCQIIGYRNDVLVFTFQQAAAAGAPRPAATAASPAAMAGREQRWCHDSHPMFAAAWLNNGYQLYQCTPDGWAVLKQTEDGENSCVMLHPTYGFALWMTQSGDISHTISLHRLIPKRTVLREGQQGKIRLAIDQNVVVTDNSIVRREPMDLPAYRTSLELPPDAVQQLGPGASLWVVIGDGEYADVWEFSLKGSRVALGVTNACLGNFE